MIDRQTIERIMNAADIVEVISEFVSLRKAGTNWKGLCPFHNEKTPSFMVSPSKGICKCFSCGKGGNVAHFLMLHEQMTYPEALKWLARKYHIEVHERELSAEDIKANNLRESLMVINQWAASYFEQNLYDTPDGQTIGMGYFRQRGFRDDIIRKFRLGYSLPVRDALSNEASKKGFNMESLAQLGLCIKHDDGRFTDKYRGRVMFPIQALDGRVIAFGGRILTSDKKTAKYINSSESEVYHKSNELYGIYLAKGAIQKADRCFLVEGYTDVISMHQSGIENVVASSGTSLTFGQIRLIRRFTNNLTVLYDGDMAGIKASLRGIDMLLEEGMNIKVLLLPDGDDPDSFARKHNSEEFVAYIDSHQEDFISFKTRILLQDTVNDPVHKAQVVGNIIQSISVIPDALIRSVYIKECSRMMDMSEQLLIRETAKYRRQYIEERRKERERQATREAEQTSEEQTTTSEAAPTESQDMKPTELQPTTIAPDSEKMEIETEESPSESSERHEKEAQLIKAIIRYGEKTMAYNEDEEGNQIAVTVIDFIKSELENDQITFESPLFNRILQEACEHCDEPGFTASNYFMYHPDSQLSQLAAEMMSDRYQLSEQFAKGFKISPEVERLHDTIPILMIDLKLVLVKNEIKTILNHLQDPAIYNDKERYTQEMQYYQDLKELQKQLTAMGGDRTITY